MKQKIILIIGISLSLAFGAKAENDKKDTTMDRIETCNKIIPDCSVVKLSQGKGATPS